MKLKDEQLDSLFNHIREGNIEEIQKLVNEGYSLHVVHPTLSLSPLELAWTREDETLVKIFLEQDKTLLLDLLNASMAKENFCCLYALRHNLSLFTIVMETGVTLISDILETNKQLPNFLYLILVAEVYFGLKYFSSLDPNYNDQFKTSFYSDLLSKEIAKLTDIKQRIYILLSLSSGHISQGNIVFAEKQFLYVTQLAVNHSDVVQAWIKNHYINFLITNNYKNEAEKHLKQNYLFCKDDKIRLLSLMKILTIKFLSFDDFEVINNYLIAAEKLSLKFQDKVKIARIYVLKSFYYYMKEEYQNGVNESYKALSYVESKEQSNYSQSNYYLALNYLKLEKINKAVACFNQMGETPFDFLQKALSYKMRYTYSPAVFKKLFDGFRNDLYGALKEKSDQKLMIAMCGYVFVFHSFVPVHCLREYRSQLDNFWELYAAIVYAIIKQDANKLEILRKHCSISYCVSFNYLPSIIQAVIDHMYQTAYLFTGNNITAELQNANYLPQSMILKNICDGKVTSSETVIYLGDFDKTTPLSTDGMIQNLITSYNSLKLAVEGRYAVRGNFPSYFITVVKPALNTNEDKDNVLNDIGFLRVLLNDFYGYGLTSINLGDTSKFSIVEEYLFNLMFVFYSNVMFFIDQFKTSTLYPKAKEMCLLYANLQPVAKDYNGRWLTAFVRNVSVKFHGYFGKDASKTGNLLGVILFHMYLLCKSLSTNDKELFEVIEKDFKQLSYQVKKSYQDLGKVSVNDYIREFEIFSKQIDFVVTYTGLNVTFNNKVLLDFLKEKLDRKEIPYQREEDSSITILSFRSHGNKIKNLGNAIREKIYNEKNSNNIASISVVSDNDQDKKDDKFKEENLDEKKFEIPRKNTKKTKNEEKTEYIKSLLLTKKELKKTKTNKPIKSKSESEPKQQKRTTTLSNIKSKIVANNSDTLEVIVNNPLPETPFSQVISSAKEEEVSKEFPAWINLKLMKIAQNHGIELVKLLAKIKDHQFVIDDDSILLFLYHGIRMLHSLSLCRDHDVLASAIDLKDVWFFRNILLYEQIYFLRPNHHRLLLSKNHGALIYLLTDQILPLLDYILNNKINLIDKVNMKESTLYQIFNTYSRFKFSTSPAVDVINFIKTELELIDKCVAKISPIDNILDDENINILKMRLVKIGCFAKSLRITDSSFCARFFSSLLRPQTYNMQIMAFLKANSKLYEEMQQDILNPRSSPMLKQLNCLTPENVGKALSLFRFADFLALSIEIRKTVGHKISSAKFIDQIFAYFEELSPALVIDIAALANRFLPEVAQISLTANDNSKQESEQLSDSKDLSINFF